jgi:16S rRNA (cytosine967-C5)-methyltransferase
MNRSRVAPQPEVAGLAARRIATAILDGVIRRKRPLDDQLEGKDAYLGIERLADRDRALVRRLVATALRRRGTLRHLVDLQLARGWPADAPLIESILLIGASQILFLDVPDHAAVDLAVRLAQADRHGARYSGLVNAVLRNIARAGTGVLADLDVAALDMPAWLFDRWTRHYGEPAARAIAAINAQEPALDLTVKGDADSWAQRLRGRVLPTGTVRAAVHGPVSMLPGFQEGAWWVQDAAAALPVQLFGDLTGKRVVDLCAAPGGKTAQLALAGAAVTAVDRSGPRLNRLRDNLQRLGLSAEVVIADATEWNAEPFDAVLVDAPCSSTGTIRRHPDIPWLKQENDITALANLQRRLIDRAVALTKPGGTIVYCTCSLEPDEGETIVAGLLERDSRVRRAPLAPAEVFGLSALITADGDLRSLPSFLPDPDPQMAGLDGFFAARLTRQ